MDLSWAFDTLNHYLLIAKLNAYGFQHALKRIYSYLTSRRHRARINTMFVLGKSKYKRYPNISVFGFLLFNR